MDGLGAGFLFGNVDEHVRLESDVFNDDEKKQLRGLSSMGVTWVIMIKNFLCKTFKKYLFFEKWKLNSLIWKVNDLFLLNSWKFFVEFIDFAEKSTKIKTNDFFFRSFSSPAHAVTVIFSGVIEEYDKEAKKLGEFYKKPYLINYCPPANQHQLENTI